MWFPTMWHFDNCRLWRACEVSKGAKIRNRYNQVPHLTQDTNGKVTNSQLDTTNESQEVSPLPAGDHKVSKGTKIMNRYNQVPQLTQDTNGKVTNSQLDTTNESQEVRWPQSSFKQTLTKAKQTQDRKNIKDPQKKYHLGTVSKIFYWRA